MRIRDALEADAGALAALAGVPETAMANAVHERSVRVAIGGATGTDDTLNTDAAIGTDPDMDRDRNPDIRGFIAFDVADGVVHITDFAGSTPTVRSLIEDPRRFARREGMPLETLLPETDTDRQAIVREIGFERIAQGPVFDGARTERFRLETNTPGKADK